MASSAQAYYLQAALELVLFPMLRRSRRYAALPRLDHHYDDDAPLTRDRRSEAMNSMEMDAYIQTHSMVGMGSPPPNSGTLPSLWEAVQQGRLLIGGVLRRMVRSTTTRHYNQVYSNGLRHSHRLEAQDTPWWEATVAHWTAYVNWLEAIADALLNGGLPAALECVARTDPDAFWAGYWHVLIYAQSTPDQTALYARGGERLAWLLCDEVMRRLYPEQQDACCAALNVVLNRLRLDHREELLVQDNVSRALINARIKLTPLLAALGSESRRAFRDVPAI
jgi:hypothetical protein